jgi:hypothetical protein
MNKTSAAVLSLLFASTYATKLNIAGDDKADKGSSAPGYEAVSAEAEKVHVLDIGANTRSNSDEAFPNPFRTAYYGQMEKDGTFYDK